MVKPTENIYLLPKATLPDAITSSVHPENIIRSLEDRTCQCPLCEAFTHPWHPIRLINTQSIPHVILLSLQIPLHGSPHARNPLFCMAFLPALMVLLFFFLPLRHEELFHAFDGTSLYVPLGFPSSHCSSPLLHQYHVRPEFIYSRSLCTACFTNISSPTDTAGLSFLFPSGSM